MFLCFGVIHHSCDLNSPCLNEKAIMRYEFQNKRMLPCCQYPSAVIWPPTSPPLRNDSSERFRIIQISSEELNIFFCYVLKHVNERYEIMEAHGSILAGIKTTDFWLPALNFDHNPAAHQQVMDCKSTRKSQGSFINTKRENVGVVQSYRYLGVQEYS